ncbi:MAG: DUF4197 domain-containing protein [Bacteroidales bacterium]|nr:DUF4197 domain-containing protein [Bacteroidales bacterium]
MNKKLSKFFKHQLIWGTVVMVFMLSCWPIAAGAESAWWEKGKNLFNSFESSEKIETPGTEDIGAALKDALRVGTESVVHQLGKVDGFQGDSAVHIPLPESFRPVQSVLAKLGVSSLLDNLELKLNRAAEAVTPKAKTFFRQAIKEMTFDDVQAIYKGPTDAATKYFQRKMSPALAQEMRPLVEDSLSDVGAIKAYDNVMGQYLSIPFVPDVKANIAGHVIEKGMDGIFYYLAQEEAAIRQNPARQTTDLLKRVFGKK